MTGTTGMRCLEGCDVVVDVRSCSLSCPQCGGLLDVRHTDPEREQWTGAQWRACFDARRGRGGHPGGSGVWLYKEWVMPHLPEESIVSLGEGNTPLIEFPRLAERVGVDRLAVKSCGVSPTGSFKDLGMTVLVSVVNWLRASGSSLEVIGCASTGDTSAALAAYAAAAGIPSVVLLPEGKISPAQLIQPLSNQARVLALATDFDGCMELIHALANQGVLYLANSMNPLRLEGQKTAAYEMAHQRQWTVPDVVILPGGNLGNVYAFGRAFQWMYQRGVTTSVPRMVVAQAQAANPFYRSYQDGFSERHSLTAGATEASAIRIGDPVSYPRARRIIEETEGTVMDVTESELAEAAALADSHGSYFDPHSGVALAALDKLVRLGEIHSSSDVVVVSTAHGLKFTEHKRSYHQGTLPGCSSVMANSPIRVDAEVEDVMRALSLEKDDAPL